LQVLYKTGLLILKNYGQVTHKPSKFLEGLGFCSQ